MLGGLSAGVAAQSPSKRSRSPGVVAQSPAKRLKQQGQIKSFFKPFFYIQCDSKFLSIEIHCSNIPHHLHIVHFIEQYKNPKW